MDSSSFKILTDLYFPVLVCYAVIFFGFLYMRYKWAKGKPKKPKSVFMKMVLWISIGLIIVFFIAVSQIARTMNF